LKYHLHSQKPEEGLLERESETRQAMTSNLTVETLLGHYASEDTSPKCHSVSRSLLDEQIHFVPLTLGRGGPFTDLGDGCRVQEMLGSAIREL